MPGPLTRVISDLHYRDGDCRLVDLRQLEPLLKGVDHIIFNGDSIDTQRTPNAVSHVADLGRVARSLCPQVTFITGNHDPLISKQHTLTLPGGVWLVHGDILYEGVAPWSCLGPTFAAEVRRRRATLGLGVGSPLAELFEVHRAVCSEIHVEFDVARTDLPYRLYRFGRALLPPRQLLTMLEVWRHMARDAAALAERYAPGARFILVGHSHSPGVHSVGGRVVINTGSFCRPRGQCCVDLQDGLLRVKQVRQADQGFVAAKVLREFPLAKDALSG